MRHHFLLVFLVMFLVACNHVQPWEKVHLAKPEMSLEYDQVTQELDDHVYFSKEATAGGKGFSGGGCGCN